MQLDGGVELSRHDIAEHHEMDEMVEGLEETDPSSPSWLAQAKALDGGRFSFTGQERWQILPGRS